MSKETRQRLIYVVSDFLMTNVAILLFNIIRYHSFIEWRGNIRSFLLNENIIMGQVMLPIGMMLIYYLSGYYYDVVLRSRMDEFFKALISTALGAIMIYFIILVNDGIDDRGGIYEMIGILWGVLFGCVYLPRLVITLTVVKQVHKRKVGYNTLIVGTSQGAFNLVKRLNSLNKSMGFNIVGYVEYQHPLVSNENYLRETSKLPVYDIDDIERVCRDKEIVNLIVLPHSDGQHATLDLIGRLFLLGKSIYVSPLIFQLISGRSTFDNVAGEPLIDISKPDISTMTIAMKRASDIVVSALTLVLIAPILAVIAFAVKRDSSGPVFYRQERIGYHKRKFKIIKFRTMRTDAEANGPALSSPNDERVTHVGSILRKYRLDELPQFWNVIKGDMSIVGPRPEREFYVRQIVDRVPYYTLIHGVRPGITSWGMVKYGYAQNVDEMVDRLKYDLIYIENVSIGVDLKIILYTIRTVVTGKGV